MTETPAAALESLAAFEASIATTDVQPAKTRKKTRPTSQPDQPDQPDQSSEFVDFISTNDEPFAFQVSGILPDRPDTSRNLRWRVPAEHADLFERHHHVQQGRITRAK
jgi:hypothetical protein